jgi:hypothetical protein
MNFQNRHDPDSHFERYAKRSRGCDRPSAARGWSTDDVALSCGRVAFSQLAPLLVVGDVLVGAQGLILLPAVRREGLALGVGDLVDVVRDDERVEVEVLSLDPDGDPACVRLRVASRVPIAPGFEVWPSQSQSHLTLKRPALRPGERVVSIAGAISKRRA